MEGIKRPTNRPTHKPANQPINQPTNQPTDRPTDRPTNRPTNQPSDQPTNQPTRQPTNNQIAPACSLTSNSSSSAWLAPDVTFSASCFPLPSLSSPPASWTTPAKCTDQATTSRNGRIGLDAGKTARGQEQREDDRNAVYLGAPHLAPDVTCRCRPACRQPQVDRGFVTMMMMSHWHWDEPLPQRDPCHRISPLDISWNENHHSSIMGCGASKTADAAVAPVAGDLLCCPRLFPFSLCCTRPAWFASSLARRGQVHTCQVCSARPTMQGQRDVALCPDTTPDRCR